VDIFISYTESDRPWAFWIGKELQRLGHTPHIHEWEISGGDDIPKWMEERLQTADRVLCVVSLKYLTKDYSGWERRSAEWAAVKDRPNFVLPVLVEDCDVPLLLAPFKRCDLFKAGTDEQGARATFEIFLTEAKPPTQPVPFPGGARPAADGAGVPQAVAFPVGRAELGSIKTGIESLRNQSDANPQVRSRVVQDREKLDHLKDRIDLISHLKELHDFLHDLQIQVYPQILDYVDVLETDPGARFGLAQILVQLGEDCKRARKTAAGLPDDDPDRDAAWLTDLENALPILQSAAQAKDAHVAREATSPFRSVILRKQLTIDERLHALAKSLPFGVLRELLKDAGEMVRQGDDFERWKRAQDSLQTQETDLNGMVEEHHAWQNLEPSFVLADQSIGKEVATFKIIWPDLRDPVKHIAGKYPDAQWAKQSSDLSDMVETAIGQANVPQVRAFFKYFRNNSLQHFWALDKQLKEKCEEISDIREPLQKLLESAKP
jgi:TIR domain